jgi:NAD(P)-dependent dehydrogenase (short-subunit alcohol dehydrogenase family)
MDLHLAGKTAVVTGASKGIGFAITRALAGEGVSVVAGARTATTELSDLAARTTVQAVPVDLTTPDGPARLVEAAIAAHDGLDILVNNVGAVRPRTGGFLTVTDDGTGAIVTINSVNARLPDPLVIDYSAAKAALANFSKSLSKEVASRGIRVTTVSPGPVSTGLWLGTDGVAATVARAAGAAPEAVAQKAAGESVTGRFTQPQEVADLVLLLASDRSGNITGADFVIDGGLITTL